MYKLNTTHFSQNQILKAYILIMSRQQFHKQTGSHSLIRNHFFNNEQPDVDVPDGDLDFGRKMVVIFLRRCHNHIGGGPSLISIYGMSGGNQKAFTKYSDKTKGLKGVKWSKERLYKMLENPEQLFGVESAMVFDGIKDPYVRASIIEYIQFMRLTDHQAKKPKQYVYS